MKSIENNTSSDKADLLKDVANIVTQKKELTNDISDPGCNHVYRIYADYV